MGNRQSAQTPSGFNSYTTVDQAARDVDLSGKVAIVTGANIGIGLETARVLAKHGATVVIGCRDLAKAEAAAESIKEREGGSVKGTLETLRLDLASLESVRDFAQEFKNKHDVLNILVNNAGVFACPKMLTKDGFEMQFGTNHLGHFLLFNLLVDELKRGAPSRVVIVSSQSHEGNNVINWDDINWEKSYSRMGAYGQSKGANVLFANGIARRFADSGITANALHPGFVNTNVARHMGGEAFGGFVTGTMERLGFAKSTLQGAATTMYVATAPELEKVSGKYFSDCNEVASAPYTVDPQCIDRMWELSEKLVGLKK